MMELSILALIGYALSIYALYNVWTSTSSTGGKIIWTLALILLPVISFIAWLFFGPRNASGARV